MTQLNDGYHGPLEGIRVLEAATLFAGPMTGMILADFGAEVIKIEHPGGDPVRNHGRKKDGVPLWWKMVGRNKKAVTLYLGSAEGQEMFSKMAEHCDVIIENFRPGTLERWNLGWERLKEINPRLILLRVTGFGQFGPYSSRPGFGTLAESMSGFAAITGQADGPPTLPPFGLADGIAGLAGAIAVLTAIRHRDVTGHGQMIDLAIIEPILSILGPQVIAYDQLGVIQKRAGNRSDNNAPRNTYKTSDDKWVAVSTSAQSIAERVMRLVGHPEVIAEPWFASGGERAKHADELDEMVGSWIAQRPLQEVTDAFEQAEAAVVPVYDVSQIVEDPQFKALESLVRVVDEELGSVLMQNVMFRMSDSPGLVRSTGRKIGQDNEEVFAGLGYTAQDLVRLKKKGVV